MFHSGAPFGRGPGDVRKEIGLLWPYLFRSVASALHGSLDQPALVMTAPNKRSSALRVIDLRDHQVDLSRGLGDLPELWYPNVPDWWTGGARYLTAEETAKARGKKSYPEETNRYMVLETDTLLVPENAQGALSEGELAERMDLQRSAVLHAAKASGLPFALAIDSGHKSIHFVLSFTDSADELRSFRQRARINRVADLLGVVLGQLDLNVCRFFGRGWWARFPYGYRAEQGCLQQVLELGRPTTTRELLDWARRQLEPGAYQEIITSTSRKCTNTKRPFALYRPGWSNAVLSGGEGGRGSGWWQVAKELRKTGSKPPQCLETPVQRPPYGVWDASYLWHASAWLYHQRTDGWFFSQDPVDYTPQSGGQGNTQEGLRERLRWPDDDYRQLQAEQQSYERTPYDPDEAMDLDRRRRTWSPEFQRVVDRCYEDTAAWEAEVVEKKAELVLEAGSKGKTVEEYLQRRRRKEPSPLEAAAARALGVPPATGGGGSGNSSGDWLHHPYVDRILGRDGQPPLLDPRTVRHASSLRHLGWYLFNGRHWENVPDLQIEKLISDLTGRQFTLKKEAAIMRGVSQQVSWEYEWAQPGQGAAGYMAFKNGTLVVDFERKNYTFLENEWVPEHNIRHYIDGDFFDEGTVPDELANVIFRGIPDPEDRESMLQFFGSILVPGQPTQTWGLIEGRGGDGKSVLVDILKAMVGGSKEYCAINLHQLGNKFHLSTAEERLLAVDPDAQALTPSSHTGAEAYITGTLKAWTGDDEVYLERKGAQGYGAKMDAKFLALVNEKPHINDTTDGFWRRLRYWFWDAPKITSDERILSLGSVIAGKPELIDQLRGAAFAAFMRAVRAGSVLVSKSMEARLLGYHQSVDSVASFCAQYLHKIPENPVHYWESVVQGTWPEELPLRGTQYAVEQLTRARNGLGEAYTVKALFKCYKRHCEEGGMPSVRFLNKFMERLKARGYDIQRARRSEHLVIRGSDPKVERPRESVMNAWCSYEDLPNIEVAIASGMEESVAY